MRVQEFQLLVTFWVISQLLVQISAHFSTISKFARSQILAINSTSRYFSADSSKAFDQFSAII